MPFGFRSDGKKIKSLDPIYKIIPHFMKTRHEAQVLFKTDIDCSGIEEFIAAQRSGGVKLDYYGIILTAVVRTIAQRPRINRFVMNGRVYKRNAIQISFAVKKILRDGAEETTIKLTFDGTESVFDVQKKMSAAIAAEMGGAENDTDKFARILTRVPNALIKAGVNLVLWLDKHSMLPSFIIELSPFHTSCFVTILKSIRTDYVYHHLYDVGTIGFFISIGKETLKPAAVHGELGLPKIMTMGIVIDERVCDGLYWSTSMKMFAKILTNPGQLTEPLPARVPDDD